VRYELLVDGEAHGKAASDEAACAWIRAYRAEHAQDDPDATHVQVRRLSALSWLTGGSLVPGKRADLTVVSLDGSPYHPWEDPAVAVVFGGSPERVVTTLVDGEAVYERGGFAWHELRRKATSARAKMLGGSNAPAAGVPVAGS